MMGGEGDALKGAEGQYESEHDWSGPGPDKTPPAGWKETAWEVTTEIPPKQRHAIREALAKYEAEVVRIRQERDDAQKQSDLANQMYKQAVDRERESHAEAWTVVERLREALQRIADPPRYPYPPITHAGEIPKPLPTAKEIALAALVASPDKPPDWVDVQCVDCGATIHINPIEDDVAAEWRCGKCGRTVLARAVGGEQE
jgi:ribosomal protein S27E